ncbi:MAG: PEP-CTERM sorting domain-containing protein [Planctomycetota bacterium]|jgi:hypothetical protein
MMKKMLILTLILGMTSVASAGIVVVTPDDINASIETDPIGDVVPMQAHFVGVVSLPGSVVPTLLYGGNLAEFTDYTGADAMLTAAVDAAIAAYAALDPLDDLVGGPSAQIYFGAYYDSQDPPVDVVGQLVSLAGTGEYEVYLMDADITAAYSAVHVPEPITLGLLGLGGLFLRRRK